MTTLEINGQRGKGNFTLPSVRDEHGPARQ
jgi:hypothetical protein